MSDKSFSELYSMYLFASNMANRAFSKLPKKSKNIIRNKVEALEKEMCTILYGFDVRKESVDREMHSIEGQRPEEIDLNNVKKDSLGPKEEEKDPTQTFVVFKEEM